MELLKLIKEKAKYILVIAGCGFVAWGAIPAGEAYNWAKDAWVPAMDNLAPGLIGGAVCIATAFGLFYLENKKKKTVPA